MTNEEIKKEIYKQNPKAQLERIVKGNLIYKTDSVRPYYRAVYFSVPFEDIGDATFYSEMEAKYLIRYLNWKDKNKNDEN